MKRTIVVPALLFSLAAAMLLVVVGAQSAAARPERRAMPMSGVGEVVVPRGQPVEFAFTADTTEGEPFDSFSLSAENAIRMAVKQHPTIRGFPIQVNTVETLCLDGDNTASANAIVAHTQNTAVLGNLCSGGSRSALPIYEAAGIAAISGSASGDDLPLFGPTVFNRTIVVSNAIGDSGDLWLSRIATLPSVLAWQQQYIAEFGTTPVLSPLPALYFDAASLLVLRLQQVSRIEHGRLVINRAALASAIRGTTNFQGVTCTLTLDPSTGNRSNDPADLTRCAEG